MSGATDRLTDPVAADFLHTDGFPRIGYRIGSPITFSPTG